MFPLQPLACVYNFFKNIALRYQLYLKLKDSEQVAL